VSNKDDTFMASPISTFLWTGNLLSRHES